MLLALRTAYTHALTRPYIFALSAVCAAAFCVPAMEWKNIRTEAEERKKKGEGAEGVLGTGELVGASDQGGRPETSQMTG